MAEQMILDFSVEQWLPVVGWPDYEVSSLGRVRRATPSFSRNKNGTIREQRHVGQLLKGAIKPKTGYHSVTLHDGNGWKADINVHTLVCRAFHGPAPSPNHEVAHEDGTRTNNADTNLRWATHKENGADMAGHGRTLRGTKHHLCKLSEDDVHAIRALLDHGSSQRDVAAQYGISRPTARNIWKRNIWKWLPERQITHDPCSGWSNQPDLSAP